MFECRMLETYPAQRRHHLEVSVHHSLVDVLMDSEFLVCVCVCVFSRSEGEFLFHILGEVIKAGATTLNIPDTVGITLPSEYGKLIADIKANTPGIENVIISTHCQNDLGLSTANTLAVWFFSCYIVVISFQVGLLLCFANDVGFSKFRGRMQELDKLK